jgi:hypothetical protein
MSRSIIVLATASMLTMALAATTAAQVTGIRHSDGSWTFVDANGRDIHKDYAGQAANHDRARRHAVADVRNKTSQHDKVDHKVTGYLPWQSRPSKD